MNLKDINTSKFLFDPKDPEFENKMVERNSVFDFPKNRREWLTYIVVMYDIKSELRVNIKDLMQRKLEAGMLAGFKLKHGEFEQQVELGLLGKNEEINKAIVQYIYYMFSNDYKYLFILEENFYRAIQEQSNRLKVINKAELAAIDHMKEKIEEIEYKLFEGEETISLRKILYMGIENARDRLPRKEEEMKEYQKNGLVNYEPFPNYKPDPLKFVGDEIPE